MKIACVQFEPKLEKEKDNISKIITMLSDISADIIVFPELATSGYYFENKEQIIPFAHSFKSPEIQHFQEVASEKNATVVIGFPELDNNKIFNSAAIMMPDPTLSRVYRKTHLFYQEQFVFSSGDSGFFVINDNARNINIGTMICYDWRFPEASRSLGLLGADVILAPSNLVTDVWHLAMPARSLENKVYLVVSNRTGTESRGDNSLIFKGLSAIYSYNGKIMEKASPDLEEVLYADIDPVKTRDKSFNPYNDIFKDRRPDLYVNK